MQISDHSRLFSAFNPEYSTIYAILDIFEDSRAFGTIFAVSVQHNQDYRPLHDNSTYHS